MASRTDWTAPHWEAVAAEQILLAPTLISRKADRTVRIARSPHGGRQRLKNPETGALYKTTGDVLPLIHIPEPTSQAKISSSVFYLKKKSDKQTDHNDTVSRTNTRHQIT